VQYTILKLLRATRPMLYLPRNHRYGSSHAIPVSDTAGYGSDTRGGAVDPIAGHRLQRRRHMRLGLRWLQLSSRLVTSPAASSACCWLAKPKFSSFYFTFSSLFLSVCLGHGCAAPSNTVSATSSFRKEEEAIKNCRDCYFTYVYT
jgi:hypothetical protein